MSLIYKSLLLILLVIILTPGQSIAQKEKCLTNNEHEDRYASYSPNGEWIAFESNRHGNWEIYVMDTLGKNVKRLTENKAEDRRPSWHPDGKKILFESNRSGLNGLYTIRVTDRRAKKIVGGTENGEFIFASFSPNGKEIAVSLRESEEKSSIVLLKKNGKLVRILVDNEKRNFCPKWSKEGKEIIYFSRKETDNRDDEIYKLNVKSGEEKRLTNWAGHNFCPSWSHDNSKIAYVTSMENTRPEIYIMDSNGGHKVRVTHNDDGETLPNWHPHENKILMTAYRNGNYQICQLSLGD